MTASQQRPPPPPRPHTWAPSQLPPISFGLLCHPKLLIWGKFQTHCIQTKTREAMREEILFVLYDTGTGRLVYPD